MLLKDAKDHFSQHLENGELTIRYDSFKVAYLQHFFDRYERIDTGFILDAFDLNHDNRLSWSELHFWYLFALREHPDEIDSLNDLRTVALRDTILPLSLSSAAKSAN